jgi:hypothetical protein
MATQNVNIGINVSDNGTAKKVVRNFQEITQAATQAQQAAKSINAVPVKSTMAPGGTSGSRRASQPTGSQGIMDNESYGSARGTAGLTGASARDFANQAQGLGGLVRLYATLAANIFAASAAYTALSNAADTTNLVKGLDMLGAASGRNLGTLSKRLVEVTDGAVSMRDAMTATAQASSAGMTNKNIERLAQVAKNASLALGVAMPDALSRLSRGIVKLEPELLDELGLFTKIGPATERYALEIGKSVNALTDFERRQAFANAILDEGEKKFGALSEAASNPYDKLLATLKNVLQSGGELINKVLTPIVSLLAESPTALGAVMAGLGVLLLKQAIPAIGQMRAGLRNTAEEALETAKAFKESFGDEFQTRLEQRFKLPSLEADVKRAESELAKLKFPGKMPASITSLMDEKGELNQKKINSLLETRNKTVETGMRGSRKASEAQIEAAKQEIAYIQKAIELYTKKQALESGREGAQALADVTPGRFDAETIAAKKYQDLLNKVDRSNAISNAAQNAQIMGIRGSWALLNTEIAERGITGFQRYNTLAQGGLAAIGSRVMGLVGALGTVGQVLAIAVAGFQMLDSWLTKNAKQTENFNKALTTANDSVSNVTRTLSAATSTEGFATRTIDNTAAFSNALNELTSSASEVIKLSREADRAAGTWDNFWDSVFSVIDKDRASKLAKTVADQIKSSIRLLQREGLADEYNSEIKKILNVDSLEDTEKVAEAYKKLTKTQQDAITLLQSNANRALGNISSNLQSFKTSTEAALRAQKTLANSFIDSSPMFLYGQNLISVSQGLTKIINAGPDRVVQALEEVATNTEKMGLFGKTFVESFAGISNVFLQQAKNIEASRNALINYQKTLDQTNKVAQQGFAQTGGGAAVGSPNIQVQRTAREQASIASSDLREVQRAINAQQDGVVRQAVALAKDAAKAIYEEGLLYINKAIREAQNAAAITIGRALTVNLTGVQKIEADNRLRQQEIKYQLASIDVSEKVLDVQASLVNEMRLANALQAEANILQRNAGKTDPASKDQNTEATRQVNMARAAAGQGTAGLSAIDVAQIESDRRDARDLRRKGTQAQRIALGAQSTSSTIGVAAQRPGAEIAQAEELAKITDRTNASLLSRSQILNSITGITSTELTKAKQAAEITQLENKQKRELDEIQARITAATNLKLEAEKQNNEEGKAAAKDQQIQIDQLNKIKEATKAAQAADTSLILAKSRQELLSDEVALIGRRIELERSGAELQNTLIQSRLDTTSQELALYSSAYDFSRKFVISQQSALDIQKAQLETNRAIAQAQVAFEQKRLEAVVKINALGDGEDADQRAKEIGDELARQRTITENTVSGLKAQGAAKADILEKTREINLEQERYNLLMQRSETFAENLSSVFGELGNSLGGLSKAFTEIAISSEKRAKSEAKLASDLAAARKSNDPLEIAAAEEVLAEQKKKNAKAELADDIKALNSSKKLFKEKTAAYKVLDATEKALRTKTLVMEAQTLGKQIALWWSGVSAKVAAATAGEAATTAATGAGFASRLPIYIKEIYASWGKLGPWMVGAAALFIASKLGGGGGGGGGAFVPTAEQRQETQGTAMGWNDQGQKVQVRRGVFGDTDAKSESIANSLELIKENSVDGLSYDNRMLKTLESIDRSIGSASKGLFNIQGLRTGSMFGTVPGSQSGGGLLGTGFLGSKTTRNITDSGLLIEGTFAQLASSTNKAVIDFFEQVTVSRRSWYGKTRTWVETQRKEIDDATSEFFQDIFSNATEMFVEVGKKAGIGASAINQILGDMDVGKNFASLRGLKGEEFQQELSAIIGTVLDDAALAIFTEFEQFAKFGEGMLETVTRVVDTNEKVRQQIKNTVGQDIEATLSVVGVTVAETTRRGFFGLFRRTRLTQSFDPAEIKKISYQITESLVELSGGLENFLKQSNFFRENFLTESERLAPVQNAVTEEMNRLGFASVDTREEFKELVRSLDLTTQSGRENYQALMDVAEGFDKITAAAEEFANKAKDMQMRILELTGTPEELLAAQRSNILDETDPRLRETQAYIFALEDVKNAEDALNKARQEAPDAIKQQEQSTQGLVNNIRRYIESLRKFKESLTLGAASPLTPAQRYAESKRQFDAIFATATGTAATPEEQSAKDAALGQLEGSASAFLEASKVYNASSAQYSTDFNYIQEALTKSIDTLSQQLTNEEKLLQAQNTQIGVMQTVNTSVLSVADAINNLAAAQSRAAALKPQADTQIKSAISGTGTTPGDLVSAAKSSGVGFAYGGTVYGAQGLTTTVEASKTAIAEYINNTQSGVAGFTAKNLYGIFKDWGLSSKTIADYMGIPQDQILNWFKAQDASIPAFAAGTNFVPEDMLAQIHRGERIIPAADNTQLMQNLNSRDETNRVLVTEIRNLRQEVKQLREQQAKETGSIIVANFDAQQRAAEQIETAMNNTAQQSNWTAKVRESVKLK